MRLIRRCEASDHSSNEWASLHYHLAPAGLDDEHDSARRCDKWYLGYAFIERTTWRGAEVFAYRSPDGHEFGIGPRGALFKRMEAMDRWGRPTGTPREAQPWVPVGRMSVSSAPIHPDAATTEDGRTYADKPVHHFLQFDGWTGLRGDDDTIPDSHGDWISETPALDRRISGADLAVRVQIHEGVRRRDALRLLQKVVLALEETYEAEVPLKASFGCCTKAAEAE